MSFEKQILSFESNPVNFLKFEVKKQTNKEGASYYALCMLVKEVKTDILTDAKTMVEKSIELFPLTKMRLFKYQFDLAYMKSQGTAFYEKSAKAFESGELFNTALEYLIAFLATPYQKDMPATISVLREVVNPFFENTSGKERGYLYKQHFDFDNAKSESEKSITVDASIEFIDMLSELCEKLSHVATDIPVYFKKKYMPAVELGYEFGDDGNSRDFTKAQEHMNLFLQNKPHNEMWFRFGFTYDGAYGLLT